MGWFIKTRKEKILKLKQKIAKLEVRRTEAKRQIDKAYTPYGWRRELVGIECSLAAKNVLLESMEQDEQDKLDLMP